MQRSAAGHGMQVRKSVLLGAAFGALLLVIALSAIAVWRSAKNAQDRVADLHAASTRAATALSAIRSDIYLTAILTRDYLLDADRSRVPQYVEQFKGIRSGMEKAFAVLQTTAQDENQRLALARLSAEVDAYLGPTETALDWTPEEKSLHGYAGLRQRVHRRQEIFALVRQAETLISSNFDRERQRITRADQDFRRSFAWITGVALGVGLGIASLTLARMIRLEMQSHEAELKLRELSAQLRTAQEVERKHLSRELHDEVGQMLTGLRMELAALARLNWSSDPDVSGRITHAKATVEQTLKLVRNIAMLARPSMLDDLGLSPAISWQTREFSRATGVEVETVIDPGADTLPEAYRTCLYRVVQEALTNCARHACATRIQLSLSNASNVLSLIIQDNGSGFDRTAHQTRGLGLVGMEERVRELGGHILVKSAPGAGTRIEVELPVPQEAEVKA
ncbi:MAG: sensor histidine kinase [Acidobacteriia bacterium]|nr:sensor histidine kinase [Terriglobia bacterium]